MNASNVIQLKIIVERVVRPVRASFVRKQKMREELLAHVTAVFEEESTRLADERAALQQTAARFGNPAEVRRQLQESVPVGDHISRILENFQDFRPGESTLRRAARYAALMFVGFGALVLPIFAWQHRLNEWPLVPAAAMIVFCLTLLNNSMRTALFGPPRRSWRKVVLLGGAAALLVPAIVFTVCLIYIGRIGPSLTSALSILPWSVGLTWILVVIAACINEQWLRHRREWSSLSID